MALTIKKPAIFLAIAIVAVFVAGVLVGERFAPFGGSGSAGHRHRQIRQQGYRFINPLLECELAEDLISAPELAPFKHKVIALVDQEKAAGKVTEVAVYFRDLQDGPWFGINERLSFSPASLMKLPILIAYLKLEEQQPGMLTSRTLIWDDDEDWNGTQNLKPEQAIIRGKPYPVGELLYFMMAFSDNRAWHVLFKNIDYRFLQQILDELNVSYDPSRTEDFMTVRSYSSLLRVLYNASYLSKQHSEKALELLSHVDFRDGIVAGLPPGITFAGKFGERGLGPGGEIKQLHEFGIVYFPGNHYLLGIMTRGGDFARQAEVIRVISRLVFTEVERQTREKKSRLQEKP